MTQLFGGVSHSYLDRARQVAPSRSAHHWRGGAWRPCQGSAPRSSIPIRRAYTAQRSLRSPLRVMRRGPEAEAGTPFRVSVGSGAGGGAAWTVGAVRGEGDQSVGLRGTRIRWIIESAPSGRVSSFAGRAGSGQTYIRSLRATLGAFEARTTEFVRSSSGPRPPAPSVLTTAVISSVVNSPAFRHGRRHR